MKRFLLVLLALSLLTAAAAAADQVNWTPSLTEAIKQAKDRGSMVLICLIIDGEVANDQQQLAYLDPAFIKACQDFVCVYGNPQPSPAANQVEREGKMVTACRGAPNLAMKESINAWNEVRANYADLHTNSAGDSKIPFHFVIDADGKVLREIANGTKEGGFDAVAPAQFVSELKSLVAQHGRGLTAKEYEALSGLLEEAEKAKADGKLREALKVTGTILKAGGKTSIADRAKEIRAEIEDTGKARIEKGVAMADEDPAGAVMELEAVQDEYAGTDVAKEAKASLAELKRRPNVRSALKQISARREAAKNFKKVDEAVAKKKYATALKILDEMVKKFEGTPVAEKAQAMADELRADEEIVKLAKEQEAARYCKGWLSLARSFAQNGMIDKAKAKYQEIIDKFPGTSFAEEAAAELAKLP